jgi:undecaprenyl-diphosphatase
MAAMRLSSLFLLYALHLTSFKPVFMNEIQSIIIGIVEGITEFLPISSTAHMKFANPLVGVNGQTAFIEMFEVVIQLAAILAVVVLYFKKFIDFKRPSFYLKLVIAVIPSLVFGYLLKSHIDSALSNLVFIAFVMIGGGIILLFVDRWFQRPTIHKEADISNGTAFRIGIFQVLSILLPGLSRSAATIIGGMSQKLSRETAAEFSFFLAVPTMFAASAKSGYDAYKLDSTVFSGNHLTLLLIGSAVAFIISILAMKLFVGIVKKYGFRPFGIYRIIAGILMLILIWQGVI